MSANFLVTKTLHSPAHKGTSQQVKHLSSVDNEKGHQETETAELNTARKLVEPQSKDFNVDLKDKIATEVPGLDNFDLKKKKTKKRLPELTVQKNNMKLVAVTDERGDMKYSEVIRKDE